MGFGPVSGRLDPPNRRSPVPKPAGFENPTIPYLDPSDASALVLPGIVIEPPGPGEVSGVGSCVKGPTLRRPMGPRRFEKPHKGPPRTPLPAAEALLRAPEAQLRPLECRSAPSSKTGHQKPMAGHLKPIVGHLKSGHLKPTAGHLKPTAGHPKPVT